MAEMHASAASILSSVTVSDASVSISADPPPKPPISSSSSSCMSCRGMRSQLCITPESSNSQVSCTRRTHLQQTCASRVVTVVAVPSCTVRLETTAACTVLSSMMKGEPITASSVKDSLPSPSRHTNTRVLEG